MSTKRRSQPTRAASMKRKKSSRYPAWLTTNRVFVGGSIILSLAVIVIVAVTTSRNSYISTVNIEGVQTFPGLTASHTTTTVTYPQTPPVGGPHNPVWQQCGVYTEPIANEHAVHSLEHGAVWITYQPGLPPEQVATLQDITRRGTHRLLSPYPGIDSPIVLSAWGVQLRVDSPDDPRLMDFILKYEQGPQTPERGATCSGGETRTLSQINLG